MNTAAQNFKIQKYVAIVSIVLFLVKLAAWYQTHSVAILTDALESIVNIIASVIGLYSLHVSAKPKDTDHPYGHGKIEFISAALEGILIGIAGFLIIQEAIINLYHPHTIHQLNIGIILIVSTAVINYVLGVTCIKVGNSNNSLALISSGNHLKADTYTTSGIILGLVLLYFTNIIWIDSVVAILFAFIILYTGYKIIKSSIAGMMDEADEALLQKMVVLLNQHRTSNWIDLHNLRIIKYGATIHLDCHLTVPWYFNVHEAHKEIDHLSNLIRNNFGQSVELFVHTDGCLDFSCAICNVESCSVRKNDFVKKVVWTMDNISLDRKHQLH